MDFLFLPGTRLSVFTCLLVFFFVISVFLPFRKSDSSKRALFNIIFSFINSSLVVLIPYSLIQITEKFDNLYMGLLHRVELPVGIEIILAVIILDLAIYFQHRLSHSIPVLWRLHRFHHSDMFFDTTTGIRFHPFEILLSMAFKALVIVALGAPIEAVVIFEIILSSCSLFNHSNFKLKSWLGRVISFFILTPTLHRIHHSVHVNETNSNFGFSVVFWDKLFGTFKSSSQDAQSQMTFGLNYFRDSVDQSFLNLLLQPLRKVSDEK